MGTRLLSFSNRTVNYGAATVLLLFACNLTERELPRRRLAWLLGLVALYTIGGGLAGMALPISSSLRRSPLSFRTACKTPR